jgi:uncharacterized protein with HEPN domain
MSKIDNLTRLRHMRDAAIEALGFISGRQRNNLDIDLDIVWEVVTNDLPFLVSELGGIIQSEEHL